MDRAAVPGEPRHEVRASGAPVADLRRVAEATDRFLDTTAGFSDVDMFSESQLPGWTVGHVVTHVARNADSHVRRAEAARRGEVIDQYPGGFEGRTAEIEEGAGRRALAIFDDLARSSAALAAVWGDMPPEAWDGLSRDVGGRERRLSELPARRWQELEVHLVDLGTGVTFRDWPDAFVAVWLPKLEVHLSERLPPGRASPDQSRLSERERLAWLYGRLVPPGFPELAPW